MARNMSFSMTTEQIRWELLKEWLREEQGKLHDEDGNYDKSDHYAIGRHNMLSDVLDKMTGMDFQE